MNEQDFALWLREFTGREEANVANLDYPVEFKFWNEVYEGIFPHFYGFMPSAIREAFPNESYEQLEYRLRIHRSMTKSELWQAIFDVKRILMGDKFTIETGIELNEYLSSAKFGSDKKQLRFDKYMWDIVYPRRVLDPNAILAVIPVPSENQNESVAIELKIFSHFDIKYCSDESVIIRDSNRSTGTDEFFWIFTTSDILVSERIDNQWTVRTWYTHNNGKTGVEFLGGLHMTMSDYYTHEDICYFESDFSYAVPMMDKLERKDNQLESSTLNTVFPLRVTQGLECETCKGVGKIDKRDPITGHICYVDEHSPYPIALQTECKKCSGSGTISLGALDGIVATPKNNDTFGDDAANTGKIGDRFVQYVSPDVSSIVELRTQEDNTVVRVTEVLSITKPSKFAESGVAKEKDREGKFTKLKDISDGMSSLIWSTLETMILYRNISPQSREVELEALKIIAPEDFQIKSVNELQEEYFKDLEKKPLSIRIKQHKELLAKRFKENDDIHLLDDIAIAYTNGLYLYPLAQLEKLFNMGVISDKDVIKATRVFAVLHNLKMMGKITMGDTIEQIIEKLDEAFLPLLETEEVFTEPIPTPSIDQI
jgi:hypothetical protein